MGKGMNSNERLEAMHIFNANQTSEKSGVCWGETGTEFWLILGVRYSQKLWGLVERGANSFSVDDKREELYDTSCFVYLNPSKSDKGILCRFCLSDWLENLQVFLNTHSNDSGYLIRHLYFFWILRNPRGWETTRAVAVTWYAKGPANVKVMMLEYLFHFIPSLACSLSNLALLFMHSS